MATKTTRKLTEAELNAPDLDDEGELDVEHYPLPSAKGIKSKQLAAAWEEALSLLDAKVKSKIENKLS
jgi:hypothetical protein